MVEKEKEEQEKDLEPLVAEVDAPNHLEMLVSLIMSRTRPCSVLYSSSNVVTPCCTGPSPKAGGEGGAGGGAGGAEAVV